MLTHHESFSSKKQVIKSYRRKPFDKLILNEQYLFKKIPRLSDGNTCLYLQTSKTPIIWHNNV